MATNRKFQAKNGLDNNSNTIDNLGASGSNFGLAGGHDVTMTSTGTTSVTLPTSGTLATLSDLPTVNNGTLTLQVSGTGLSGSASFTANQSSSSTFTVTSNATSSNTGSAIVSRDSSGNFSAGTITASLTGAASLNVLKSGDTMTGSLILNADPSTALGAATKQYVDNFASGLHAHAACLIATTNTLAVMSGGTITYNNGSSGVGATLTTTGSFDTLDSRTINTGNRILVKNETAQQNNGIYTKTSSTVLTRATDFDNSPSGEITAGDFAYIQEGTLGGTQWVQTTSGTVTVGTTPIVFTQLSGSGTVTGGTGITVTGNSVALASGNTLSLFNLSTNGLVTRTASNTVTARTLEGSVGNITVTNGDGVSGNPAIDLATVTNSGSGTFLKISRDSYGRVSGTTAVVTSDITSLVDATYVNVTGDTMTGNLTLSGTGTTALIYNTTTPQARSQVYRTNGSNRWTVGVTNAAETGSNAGSDFQISRHDDSTGFVIDSPITITRSTGLISTPSNLYMSRNTPVISMNTTASAQSTQIDFRTANSVRWAIQKNNTAESGSNAGSDFIIYRYNDAGSLVDAPLQITRSTGLTTLSSLSVTGTLTGTLTGSSSLNVLKAGDTMTGALGINIADGTNGLTITGTTVGGVLSLRPDGTNGNVVRWGGSGTNSNTLRFLGASDTERMRIDNSGNVSIGNVTPLSALHIHSPAGGGDVPLITLTNAGTGTTSSDGAFIGLTNTNELSLWNRESSSIRMATSGTERMRIDSSGNVGIGAVPGTSFMLDIFKSSNNLVRIRSAATSSASLHLSGNGNIAGTNGMYVMQNSADTALVVNEASAPLVLGTAGSERMRIDSAGNVGIGAVPVDAYGRQVVINQGGTTSNPSLIHQSVGTNDERFILTNNLRRPAGAFSENFVYNKTGANGTYYQQRSGSHSWHSAPVGTAGATATITNLASLDSTGFSIFGGAPSGNITGTYVGTDYIFQTASNGSAIIANRASSDGTIVQFRRDNTTVGTISVTTTATAYNTSSDIRLKKDIVSAPSAGSKIDLMQVRSFKWRINDQVVEHGFIAQELAQVVPDAVSQGDTGTEIVDVWGVDYSKLVPMLVKEIQELRARVAALEAA